MKRTELRRLLLALLLAGAIGLAPAEAANAFGTGAAGPDVYVVQAMLKDLGYFPESITGFYGQQTTIAVRSFQAAYGLPQTGAVDEQTFKSIMWAYESDKFPSSRSAPGQQAPTPAPAPAPSGTTASLTAEEKQMVDLVNAARADAGLPALAVNPQLSETARLKSQDMVAHQYFSHDSPTYGSPFDMMQKYGISYKTAGENIACNQSVQAAHDALMASPGHKANILNSGFTAIGIGIANGGPCGKMFTEQFIGE